MTTQVTHRTNRFAGKCSQCAGFVPAGTGTLNKSPEGDWLVNHDGPCPVRADRRPPSSSLEKWAADALAQLTARDGDHARSRNGVGFNKFDSRFGHELAGGVACGLTDNQWAAAVRLLKKYRAQIGSAPSEVS